MLPTSYALWQVVQHATPRHRLEVMHDVLDILFADSPEVFDCIVAIQANNTEEWQHIRRYYNRLCDIVENDLGALTDELMELGDVMGMIREIEISERHWFFVVDYREDAE